MTVHHDSDPAGPDTGTTGSEQPRSRGLRPRDWLALGVAIGLVIGLGVGVLVARNDAGGVPAASDATSTTVTVTESAPVATDVRSDDVAPQPTGAEHDDGLDGDTGAVSDGARGDDDVVGSVQQPSEPSEPVVGGEAGPIGPLGDLSHRTPGDPLALGLVDAPVVMLVYSDYRCPYCALFSQKLEQPLIDKYVASGQMRIEWRDFPIFGDESMRAAVAGRAAAEQGKFWEFNRALYAAAPGSGHPEMPVSDLVEFAREAGVPDIAAFTADLDDPELVAAVRQDFNEGSELGVPATPSFLVNGYPLRGAQPIEEFEQLIDTVIALQDREPS